MKGEVETSETKSAASKTSGKKGGSTGGKKEFEPVDMIYCNICGVPPEYCMHDKKDSTECKEWLEKAHPEMYEKIYGVKEKASNEEGKAEESAEP